MRINVVPTYLLTDQHLRAEYLEIQAMMIPYYRRTMNSKIVKEKGFDHNRIPKDYTLGTGHATFFYDKMLFVKNRFKQVVEECQNRGFTTNLTDLDISIVDEKHKNDYNIPEDALKLNMERILLRVNKRPTWYKFHKVNITPAEYERILRKGV